MSAHDVVVVGAGGAGLAAATSAAEAGASVLVLEQREQVGGKTAIAMGSLTASATSVQARRGIADSNAAHREDLLAMLRANGRDDLSGVETSLDIVIDDGAPAVAWLESHGVRFDGPHPERSHRAYRMHCAVPDGSAYARALADALERAGGQIALGACVRAIARGTDGELVVDAGDERHGARTLILAAGDYSAGVDRFQAGERTRLRPIADWARGDGQALAGGLGASLARMDRPATAGLRFVDPPFTQPDGGLFRLGAIVVGRHGREPLAPRGDRAFFEETAEGEWFAVLGGEVAASLAVAGDDSPDARDGWLRASKAIVSSAGGHGYDYLEDALGRPGCGAAGSLRELAAAVGIDADGLEHTVTDVNGDAARPPLARPPFAALGPLRSCLTIAEGGVRVDAQLHALGHDGRRIPGVFAVGQTAAWLGYVGGHGYSIAWAIASGRRAGSAAAAKAGA